MLNKNKDFKMVFISDEMKSISVVEDLKLDGTVTHLGLIINIMKCSVFNKVNIV